MNPEEPVTTTQPRRVYDLGAAMRHHHELAGLSQAEVARRVGISRSYLSEMESGRKPMSQAMVLRIAEAVHGRRDT